MDSRTADRAKKDGVAFLVESGNTNNSEIEQYFHKMAKQSAFEGALRSISFIAKNSCRAIQIADFFAYYSRRYLRDHARFSGFHHLLNWVIGRADGLQEVYLPVRATP